MPEPNELLSNAYKLDAAQLDELERLAREIEPRWAWGARMCDMHRAERARRRRYIDAARPEIIAALIELAREGQAARELQEAEHKAYFDGLNKTLEEMRAARAAEGSGK